MRPEELVTNNTDPFTTYHRMTFERHGTVFELEVSPQAISLWYDRDKVLAAVRKDDSPQGLFRRAELTEMQGDRKQAIELFEKALAGVPAFPTPFRTEINRQLFRLYNRQAESAVRAGDLTAAERFCERMALACTTSRDEIHTILALAEIAEKQGRWADATAGLTGAIKHHGAVKFGVPAILAGDTVALRARGMAVLAQSRGQVAAQLLQQGIRPGRQDFRGDAGQLLLLAVAARSRHGGADRAARQSVAAAFARQGPGRFPPPVRGDRRRGAARSETDEATILRILGEYPHTRRPRRRWIACSPRPPSCPNRAAASPCGA